MKLNKLSCNIEILETENITDIDIKELIILTLLEFYCNSYNVEKINHNGKKYFSYSVRGVLDELKNILKITNINSYRRIIHNLIEKGYIDRVIIKNKPYLCFREKFFTNFYN